ncbi:MAG: hypothetical protein OEW17_03005 [Gemmatimonadota bacterium]|nr:hypothetical protein [Gemmatimonadota bacterium]MDH4347748.1 hypothetical protein [Gemmatimonadota bacterium]MDH5282719.1 hypothetical protein [Gemmatimonadota bacterium]
MGRIIGAVVAGYVVMFVTVFLLMTAAWLVMGADGAFEAGSWQITFAWIAVSIVVSLAAAFAGGRACSAIARDPRGPTYLMGLVFVLGVVFAIPVLTAAPDAMAALGPRPDELPMMDAMTKAQQPAWTALLNPVLGVAGVWLGARKPA